MPEGPEIHLTSKLINKVCTGKIFSGKVVKSAVSKSENIEWDEPLYGITACSRGKELQMTLYALNIKNKKEDSKLLSYKNKISVIFNFEMSGRFEYCDANSTHKHAHLKFFSNENPQVLSFVDPRRFGKWEVRSKWNSERGPCVLQEYSQFRQHVLSNLSKRFFDKPICEALLDQLYFNGIGNYLRAEVLYRAGIPPFASARSVLEPLISISTDVKIEVKQEPGQKLPQDLLQYCNTLSAEVVNLEGTGYGPDGIANGKSAFNQWLQCYYQPGMQHMQDHNKRTIWFKGKPGPLVPKETTLARKRKVAKAKTDSPTPNKKKAPGEHEKKDHMVMKPIEQMATLSPRQRITRSRTLLIKNLMKTPQKRGPTEKKTGKNK